MLDGEKPKGSQGGACNRTVCNNPASWLHKGNRKWYCPSCGRKINEQNNQILVYFVPLQTLDTPK